MPESFDLATRAVVEESRHHLGRIFGLLAQLGGKTSPAEMIEEELFRIREGFHNFKLTPVEQEHPPTDFLSGERPADMQLVYFARTMQRTQLIGHFVHRGLEVPVHYSIIGAILLRREGRRFRVWAEPELTNIVLVPYASVEDRQVLAEFKSDDKLTLVDSGGDRTEYTQLRISAVRRARELTLKLRSKLISQWREAEGADPGKALVADGMVADVPNQELSENFMALASRVYVPWQNAEILEPQLRIPAYHRGQVMRMDCTVGGDPMPKYTWFVRLRTSAKADPEFGLVRATCVATDDTQAIERANRFTSRLVDERLPVTFPAEDWDKLIFPLKLCRDYLESLVPTRETVKSYFARD